MWGKWLAALKAVYMAAENLSYPHPPAFAVDLGNSASGPSQMETVAVQTLPAGLSDQFATMLPACFPLYASAIALTLLQCFNSQAGIMIFSLFLRPCRAPERISPLTRTHPQMGRVIGLPIAVDLMRLVQWFQSDQIVVIAQALVVRVLFASANVEQTANRARILRFAAINHSDKRRIAPALVVVGSGVR